MVGVFDWLLSSRKGGVSATAFSPCADERRPIIALIVFNHPIQALASLHMNPPDTYSNSSPSTPTLSADMTDRMSNLCSRLLVGTFTAVGDGLSIKDLPRISLKRKQYV